MNEILNENKELHVRDELLLIAHATRLVMAKSLNQPNREREFWWRSSEENDFAPALGMRTVFNSAERNNSNLKIIVANLEIDPNGLDEVSMSIEANSRDTLDNDPWASDFVDGFRQIVADPQSKFGICFHRMLQNDRIRELYGLSYTPKPELIPELAGEPTGLLVVEVPAYRHRTISDDVHMLKQSDE